MGCAIATVKYLLFFFNLVFALCGLALVVAGALILADIDEATNILKDINVSASPIALIVVGSIVFVIAFYGCCGAIRESHCMIVTFAVFLIVILIAEIAIGVVAFVNKDGWDNEIKNGLEDVFGKYDVLNPSNPGNVDVDNLQKNLQCCGIEGPEYWQKLAHPMLTPPKSCCKNPDGDCSSYSERLIYTAGCEDKVKELLKAGGLILGVLAIVIGVIEITGVIFALCLASSIKNRERRG